MKKAPAAVSLLLAAMPFALLLYLIVADKGSPWLKIALVGAFVALAFGPMILALVASGVRRGKAKGQVKDWLGAEMEFDVDESDGERKDGG